MTRGGLSARPLAARHAAYTISPSAEKGLPDSCCSRLAGRCAGWPKLQSTAPIIALGRRLRMLGSPTTRGRLVSCAIVTRRVAFCRTENIGTPNLSYAAQYLACALPCERFTPTLTASPCITRGRCGSLSLHRSGLAPPTFRQSPGAPVHSIKSGHRRPRLGSRGMRNSLVGCGCTTALGAR